MIELLMLQGVLTSWFLNQASSSPGPQKEDEIIPAPKTEVGDEDDTQPFIRAPKG